MPMDVAEDMSSGGMTEFRPKFVRCGTVVALGEGKSASALPLEIGQQVVVSPTGGVKFLQDGKDGGDVATYLFDVDDVWATAA